MREPPFWWEKPGLAARLLSPLAFCYGAIAAARMRHGGVNAGIPVICVGNFTHGGAGKTPAALTVARLLGEAGEKPFFLSRGYGGRLKGRVRVDPALHRAVDVGDEPLLLAKRAPTIVAADRVAGARSARAAGASVIVMDDGLQNPSLEKDFSIAVVDARRGIGNGHVFPAGPLRAPLAAQMRQCNALLVVGKGPNAGMLPKHGNLAALHGRLDPDPQALKALGRKKVLAFAGIGDPEKFFSTLAAAGIEAAAEISFPDHHRYTRADAERILARCDAERLLPVTTEKDLVRLTGEDETIARLCARAQALPVTLVIEEEETLRKLLRQALAAARGLS
jgi:tetraacyldisaccharide 4'-kinase